MAISFLFKRIYRYQSHDYAFSSVEKLLHSLGGDDYLGLFNRSLIETLQKAGFSEKFLDEIITPVMRVNYGQTMNINGFVGKSGLAIVMDISLQSGLPDAVVAPLGHVLEKTAFLCETSDTIKMLAKLCICKCAFLWEQSL